MIVLRFTTEEAPLGCHPTFTILSSVLRYTLFFQAGAYVLSSQAASPRCTIFCTYSMAMS
jgi:hypothetical protein